MEYEFTVDDLVITYEVTDERPCGPEEDINILWVQYADGRDYESFNYPRYIWIAAEKDWENKKAEYEIEMLD